MPLPKGKFKVFISHATTEDGELVRWIAEALDRLYIRAFVYESYQIGGQNRFEVIKANISACQYFLAILTQAGIASQWVNQEIGYAVGVNKQIIPVIEVDSYSGKRLQSNGFIELHDPLHYNKNDTTSLMANIIYTFYSLESQSGQWTDKIYLSCECGHNFNGTLKFDENLERWNKSNQKDRFSLFWDCEKCKQRINLSFPDCHIVPKDASFFPWLINPL